MALRAALGALVVAVAGAVLAAEPGALDVDATARYLAEQTLLYRLRHVEHTKRATALALDSFRRAHEPPRSAADVSMLLLLQRIEAGGGDRAASVRPLIDRLQRASRTAPPDLSSAEIVQRVAIDRTLGALYDGGISCCPCSTAATCDDHRFCNGAETCGPANVCTAGALPCVDGASCTSDVCLEGTQSCRFDPLPPPDEVASLAVERDGATPGGATLSWSPVAAADAYNVYRGAMPDLADLSCFAPLVPDTTVDDAGTPAGMFLYLVSAVGCGESGLGDASSGERPQPPSCP